MSPPIDVGSSSDEESTSLSRIGTKTAGVTISRKVQKTLMESTDGEKFHARTVEQLTKILTNGTPDKTQPAALGVLENLSSKESNISKTIVSSRVINGTTALGMSQDVAQMLVNAEKVANARK